MHCRAMRCSARTTPPKSLSEQRKRLLKQLMVLVIATGGHGSLTLRINLRHIWLAIASILEHGPLDPFGFYSQAVDIWGKASVVGSHPVV